MNGESKQVTEALERLQKAGYQIGDHFQHEGSGIEFILISDVAVKRSDVIKLADGKVTLEDLKHPDSQ